MKHHYEDVWQAVYTFVPLYRVTRKMGSQVTLPEALSTAAVNIFLMQNDKKATFTDEQKVHAEIIHDVLTELKLNGKMNLF